MIELTLWPDGKKLVLVLNVSFGTWAADDASLRSAGPMQALPEGLVDTMALSWTSYAGKIGIWRIMDMLDEFRAKASISIYNLSTQKYPEAVKELAKRGHELVARGDRIPVYFKDSEAERQNILHAKKSIESLIGQRPIGWVSPRATPSPNTPRLLSEEGFLWYGDCFDSDLPYAIKFGDNTIVAMPTSIDYTDQRIFVRLGQGPRQYLQLFKDHFDYLRESSPPTMLDFSIHAHIFGRAFAAWVLRDILRYVSGFPDVWIARRCDVAKYYLENMNR